MGVSQICFIDLHVHVLEQNLEQNSFIWKMNSSDFSRLWNCNLTFSFYFYFQIESPLFCSILDRADVYGIIKDTKVW